MKEIDNIVIQLKDLDDEQEYKTVRDVVKTIQELGSEEKVNAFYDEYTDLDGELEDDFLNKNVDDLNESEDEDKYNNLIDTAKNVLELYQKELTEDDENEINEDKASMGIKD